VPQRHLQSGLHAMWRPKPRRSDDRTAGCRELRTLLDKIVIRCFGDQPVVMRRRIVVLTLSIVSVSSHGRAQSADAGATQDSGTDPKPNWSVHASAATYVLPDEDDYVQPTMAIDRGAPHFEGRYNYEDRR
jgi:hypothetical protein